MESSVGGIMNKFKLKRRRVTLFFEDIVAEYIKKCEVAGYAKEMREIGELWGVLGTKILTPTPIKKLPLPLFSNIAKMIWVHIGILSNSEIKRTGKMVTLTTERDALTRIIGKNTLVEGSFAGVLGVYLNSDLKLVRVSQTTQFSKYEYLILDGQKDIKGRSKDEYNQLNKIPPMKGYTLKDAIRKKVFQLKGNRMYFRGKSICNSENTLFHLIGNHNIMLDVVPKISYEYFSNVVEKNVPKEKKLVLLKTLLQIMGWGVIKIRMKDKDEILVEITHLPCGLQQQNDNWIFLIKTVLGYLWIINKNLEIKRTTQGKNYVKIDCAVSRS